MGSMSGTQLRHRHLHPCATVDAMQPGVLVLVVTQAEPGARDALRGVETSAAKLMPVPITGRRPTCHLPTRLRTQHARAPVRDL